MGEQFGDGGLETCALGLFAVAIKEDGLVLVVGAEGVVCFLACRASISE